MIPKNIVEKIKTHFMFNNFFPLEKYGTAWQATDGDKAHALWMLDIKGYRHTLLILNTYSFPQQQQLRERASMLRLYVHWLWYNKFGRHASDSSVNTKKSSESQDHS
jgi:hypothetical protein